MSQYESATILESSEKTGKYPELTVEFAFRRQDGKDDSHIETLHATGFESLFQAEYWGRNQAARLSVKHGVALWLSHISVSNGDFLCEAVPEYWNEGVKLL